MNVTGCACCVTVSQLPCDLFLCCAEGCAPRGVEMSEDVASVTMTEGRDNVALVYCYSDTSEDPVVWIQQER